MTKKQFIDSLSAIIKEPISVYDTDSFLKEETSTNSWSIKIPLALRNQITISEFQEVVCKIKEDRWKQLVQSGIAVSLIWYSWYDFINESYKFNIINSSHKELSFNSKVEFIENEREILEDFLYPKHIEITFEYLLSLKETDTWDKRLKVYQEHFG